MRCSRLLAHLVKFGSLQCQVRHAIAHTLIVRGESERLFVKTANMLTTETGEERRCLHPIQFHYNSRKRKRDKWHCLL